ncbi:2,3,4,5-tetrahydropyridine-2,6-dicarboxylate N-acetyltransferase [Oceanotoga sp. DSM 15011]|jgi:2,3,4,5-tetrahydropyridine-2,6-dicarboxylate N-acetyltransferase|uniref:2,3,4,5-tetrahydropyridine-2,6-dicarboxylate N-acetyltransferase n=1 Tax=Oceanotoga teriensis TaxID=515440 RepID=A0AA45C794_9BACT|nr:MULTISPECIES: 2,3,4,5-tetrahydropyridine-2,6-dicarboxylate N-acetyltransferase [Oceanotoga]MDO7976757.1 2,3,4,5-tetrahydropyridine-2,6-dicarboxylate N-acetyltransferase [Oceanotoga teriensis]PWJ95267.1 2,3,4,5-tetrahydropyridine-2,6-dicarboxylate N-acetyltransferase [Oceanotoga teriensis]UYP00610.1 2,3,4,5-tetrahydropyridine-2,6-dicarboxylate N-acetyltransferase [Oceanotoga sp. DSM 15011]
MDSFQIIEYISNSEKKTPLKVYLKGDLNFLEKEENYYGDEKNGILFIEEKNFQKIYQENKEKIKKFKIEYDRKNSAIPLADYSKYNARIEPGVNIREMVEIGNNCVIMMGAVINIGAKIEEKTMIDMNVVIGGRAQIGKNCHIGAGAVIAGVIEPPSAQPVIIEDNVLVGANAVILEGVKIGKNSVIAAGSIVTKNVEENTVVAGVPAKKIKKIDIETKNKTQIMEELRNL